MFFSVLCDPCFSFRACHLSHLVSYWPLSNIPILRTLSNHRTSPSGVLFSLLPRRPGYLYINYNWTLINLRRIQDIIVQNKGSLVLELQQRSIEFNSIIQKHQNIRYTTQLHISQLIVVKFWNIFLVLN